MSFQAYLDNIKTKTGKTPEYFKNQLEKQGLLKSDMKANELVIWLRDNYDLGHGHSMAIWNVFVRKGWVDAKGSKLKSRG